ncbi:hypothetical protein ACIBI8_37050 [Streptomyces sp. NPDC050529]|uniref:hypothetical protein n=1 Tax=Streptomyces sp. NPDC050529 TaxID=3365624 RepID=UPI00379514EB
MSTTVTPAAVPDPNDPAGTTPVPGPLTGLLASMVAPVTPARPTFNLDPATATTAGQADPGDGSGDPSVSVSSDSFHDDENATGDTKNTTANSGSGKAQTGIWRAWLIAGATRWGKGGGTANKRYDMKKAKAQAQQVKETRTVTINRTPAGPSKGGGSRTSNATGPAGGKGLSGKSGTGGGSASPKNTGPAAKNDSRGPAGRDTKGSSGGAGAGSGGGRGPSGGGSAAGPKNAPAPKQQKPTKTDTPSPKAPKNNTSTDQKTPKPSSTDQKTGKPSPGTGAAGGSAGAKGAAGGSGKDGPAPKTPAPATGASATPDTKTTGTGTTKDTKAGTDTPDRKKTSLIKRDKAAKTDPAADKKPTSEKDSPGKDDGEKEDTKRTVDGKPKPPISSTKLISTRQSRETGYRDGSFIAKVSTNAKAYADGVRDGWADTNEAAAREKAQLDEAHALRKQQLEQEREQQVTATSADHHQAQPIEVTGTDEKNVFLGAGAARDSLTRGEVRSLKAFERRLEAKVAVLLRGAEQARTLQGWAAEQAKEVTQFLEQARGSKAGEKVIGSLLKTQEATTAQIRAAEDLYKRAIRGADQSSAVLANVKTRYEALYAAVVNSPETKPAEMSFYRDGALTHA